MNYKYTRYDTQGKYCVYGISEHSYYYINNDSIDINIIVIIDKYSTCTCSSRLNS